MIERRLLLLLALSGWIVAAGLFVLMLRAQLLPPALQAGRPAAAPSPAPQVEHCAFCGAAFELSDLSPSLLFQGRLLRFCGRSEAGRSHRDLFLLQPRKAQPTAPPQPTPEPKAPVAAAPSPVEAEATPSHARLRPLSEALTPLAQPRPLSQGAKP